MPQLPHVPAQPASSIAVRLGTIAACHHQVTTCQASEFIGRLFLYRLKQRAFHARRETTAQSLDVSAAAYLGSATELLDLAKKSFPARTPETAAAHQTVGDALLLDGDSNGAHRHFRRALHILHDRWNSRGRMSQVEHDIALQVVYRYVPVLLELGYPKRAASVVKLAQQVSEAIPTTAGGALADCLALWSEAVKGTHFQSAVDPALALFLERSGTRAAPFSVERVKASTAKYQAFTASITTASALVRELLPRLSLDRAPAPAETSAWLNFCLATTDLVHALQQMESRVDEDSDAARRFAAARQQRVEWLEHHAIQPEWALGSEESRLLAPALLSLASTISENAYEILERRVGQFVENPAHAPDGRRAFKFQIGLMRAERAIMVWEDLPFAENILKNLDRDPSTAPEESTNLNLLFIKLRFLQSNGSSFSEAFNDGLRRINDLVDSKRHGAIPPELLFAIETYLQTFDTIEHHELRRNLARKQRQLLVRDVCIKSAADGLASQLADWVKSRR